MEPDQSQYRQHGLDGAGYGLFLCAVVLQSIVVMALSIRLLSRKMSNAGIGPDDWAIVVSVIFDLVMTAITIADVFFGYGNPGSSLSPSDKITVLRVFWVFQIVYKIVVCSCKLSFCLFFVRLFPIGNRMLRYCNMVVMGIIASYSIASVTATILQCNPVPKVWSSSIGGACINLSAFWLCGAVYSIATDVCIIALPFILCRKLQVDKKDKLGLCCVFGAGIFIIVASTFRITTLDRSSKSVDPSSGTILSTMWTTVEANTMILVACFPSFKQPITWIYRHCKSWIGSRHVMSDHSHRSIGLHDWRASSRDIAVTTDMNVNFEKRGPESPSFKTYSGLAAAMIWARRMR